MDEWTLNDLLECSVCLERLDTSSKVLPCQHTFCKKCLEEIVHRHKELRCPECRVLVDISIGELPPNVLLMRILEGMKNAPRRTSAGVHSYHSETVTPANHSKSATTSAPNPGMRSRSSNRPAFQQVLDLRQSYAIAKCDYVSKEPGDLSFKKDDVILLRRRVEHNWYQGECNGVLGVFPLSYVHVVVQLPSHVPQCKALYDFGKCHEDDDGCLHFSKGAVITVIRRIDENWVEGKLDDRIGIFPISFVEMNYIAKNLMKTTTNSFSGLSRDAPPTPTDESVPLICKEGSGFTNNSSSQNVPDSHATIFSSSSSSSTSTATTSPTSSSESTTPSSPSLSPSTAGPPTQSVQVKRHSYTLGAQPPPYHAPPAVHRHSAEILKAENGSTELANTEQAYQSEGRSAQQKTSQMLVHRVQNQSGQPVDETSPRQVGHRKKNQNELTEVNQRETLPLCSSKQLQTNGNLIFQRQGSLRISKSSLIHSKLIDHPKLPAMYIAIYPYKPQKTDELELKVGSVYTVIERCQDGWFKGTSHPNQKCGVFPGNYVTPVNALHMLQAQVMGLVQNTTSPSHEVRASSDVRLPTSQAKSNSTTTSTTSPSNGGSGRIAPPEIPARSLSPPILQSNTSQKVSTTTWHVPSCDVVEKFVPATKSRPRSSKTETSGNSVTTLNVVQKLNDTGAVKSSEKNKDRKEKVSVSLMRRLTSMKKSRSPPPTSSFSIDNPVFEDGTSTSSFIPVAHARSDSCPSQLSYNAPQTQATSCTNHHTKIVGGSQRIKHKQRSSLQNQFTRTFDGSTSSAFSQNVKTSSKDEKPVISHRKSSSLDATVYDERETQKSRASEHSSRERYRCIAPYPPNSEFELDLMVGDVIHVHKKREDGWYKGTLQRNGRTGLFPASFVENM